MCSGDFCVCVPVYVFVTFQQYLLQRIFTANFRLIKLGFIVKGQGLSLAKCAKILLSGLLYLVYPVSLRS